MDNENSIDENYSELKKKLFSLWKTISDYQRTCFADGRVYKSC